jgi:hypothetical protein
MRRDFKKLNAEKHKKGPLSHKEASIALKSKRNHSKMIIKNKKNNNDYKQRCIIRD